jgi:hypothetical protein
MRAPLQRLATGVGVFESDGGRYAAWQAPGQRAITVYNAENRTMTRFALPEGCDLAPPVEGPYDQRAAAGRILLACVPGQQLLLAATGRTTVLPEPRGPFVNEWHAVGDAYVEGSADTSACQHSRQETAERRPCLAFYDIATRAVLYRPESAPLNIDLPAAVPVCPVVRASLVRDRRDPAASYWYAGGVLAQTVGDDRAVRLFYCNRHTLTLHGHGPVENVELRDGVLTWDTGHASADYQAGLEGSGFDTQHGVLVRYQLVNRREQVWPLPKASLLANGDPFRGVLGYSSHTNHAVFWVAARRMTCENGCTTTASDVDVAPSG